MGSHVPCTMYNHLGIMIYILREAILQKIHLMIFYNYQGLEDGMSQIR